MFKPSHFLTAILPLSIGLAVGFVGDRSFSPEASSALTAPKSAPKSPQEPPTPDLQALSTSPPSTGEEVLTSLLETDYLFAEWGAFLEWLAPQTTEVVVTQLDQLAHHDRDGDPDPVVSLVRRMLLAHLFDLEAEPAWEHTLGNKDLTTFIKNDPERGLLRVVALYSSWARQDHEACVDAMEKTPALQPVQSFVRLVPAFYHPRFDLSWAVQQGADARAYLQIWHERGMALPDLLRSLESTAELSTDEKVQTIHRLFEWAKLDAAAFRDTLAFVFSNSNEALRGAAESALEGALDRHPHPLEAIQIWQSFDGKFPSNISLFHQALAVDSKATIAWFESLEPESRKEALSYLFSGSRGLSADAVGWLPLYETLMPEERPSISQLRFHAGRLEADRPRELLSWMSGFMENHTLDERKTSEMQEWASDLAQTIALQDTEEALAQIEELPEGPLRSGYIAGSIRQLSQHDLDRAGTLLDGLPEEERRHSEASIVQNYVAHQGIDAGIAYLNGVDDPEARDAFVKRLLDDPRLAPADRARLVDTYRREAPYPLADTHYLNETWAESDPLAAGEWLQGYQSSRSYLDRIDRLFERWRYRDFGGAIEFARTLEPGPALDLAIFYLTALAREVDPLASAVWSARISEAAKRERALLQDFAGASDLGIDREAREAALEALAISESEKAALKETF